LRLAVVSFALACLFAAGLTFPVQAMPGLSIAACPAAETDESRDGKPARCAAEEGEGDEEAPEPVHLPASVARLPAASQDWTRLVARRAVGRSRPAGSAIPIRGPPTAR
jgi:hypothetical protein